MARGKSTTVAVSMEEKLGQALVPADEQPYEVPENWMWIRLGELCSDIQYGYTAKAIQNDSYPKMLRITDIQASGVDWDTVPNCKINDKGIEKYKIEVDDIFFARIGATTGKSYLVKQAPNSVYASYLIRMRVKKPISCSYVYNFLQSDLYWKQIMELSSGIALPGVNSAKLQNMIFPFPPFMEQQRIVDRIESLFTKLDEAKEKVQEVVDGFEARKAAILHKAFTGELTTQWRKNHGLGIESWEYKTLGSVCYSIFDGDHMPPPKTESGVPFLVISNVNKGVLSFENTRFVPKEYYHRLSETRKPQLDDVLYTIVGSFGIPVLIDDSRQFCFQRHMALLKPRDINSKLLWYLLQTEEAYQKASEIATGTAQLTVPIRGLRELAFLIPLHPEQTEIVRILDSLFPKEQQAKEAAETVLEQIDLIKKSILARAFRGELGTNNPAEENALELLKKIL